MDAHRNDAEQGPRLRWGILGTGNIAEQFAADLPASRRGVLQAVASRDSARSGAFATRHGAATAYGSYEELLTDRDVDAVYIALPNDLHLEWIERSAAAGKHILCEKPLALDAGEARRGVAAADAAGVLLLEAFMFRMHPQIERLSALLRDGAVGEVRIMESVFAADMGADPANFRMRRSSGGGSLMDLGCYGVSLSRLVAGVASGERFRDPETVGASGRLGDVSGIDEWGAAVLGFDTGLVATVTCGNRVSMPAVARIWGTEGSIVLAAPWQPGMRGQLPVLTVKRHGVAPEQVVVESDRPLYAIEADTFAECLESGEVPSPVMNADDTLGNMATLDAWRDAVGLVFERA